MISTSIFGYIKMLLVILISSLMNLLTLLTGGIFFIDIEKTKMLGVLTVTSKWVKTPMGWCGLFGGVIYLPPMEVDEYTKIILLHEKAHCVWLPALPTLKDMLKGIFTGKLAGHGEKTAQYEHMADLYAVTQGGDIDTLIEMLKQTYEEGDEFEKKFKGYSRQDALNRIKFLERNRDTIEKMNWERVNS